MFDVGWSELLIIGVIALLVVGPKELPGLLRTVGRFMATVKRQANEFRAQFDEAMHDAEMEDLKKQVTDIKSQAESTLREAGESIDKEMSQARDAWDGSEWDSAGKEVSTPPLQMADAGVDAGIDAGFDQGAGADAAHPVDPSPAVGTGKPGSAAIAAALAANAVAFSSSGPANGASGATDAGTVATAEPAKPVTTGTTHPT